MTRDEQREFVLQSLVSSAGEAFSKAVSEDEIITLLSAVIGDLDSAHQAWEEISPGFRKVIFDGHVIEWNIFRRTIYVQKIPTAELMQFAAEIHTNGIEGEIRRRIRSLTGEQFERLLFATLSKSKDIKNIGLTRQSGDGGLDFEGQIYLQGIWVPLVGQAKQVKNPVSVSTARDFVGSINIRYPNSPKAYGLFVSTGGYTAPASKAFDDSQYLIRYWNLDDLVEQCRDSFTQRVDLSFRVADTTFWDEIVGRA